MQSRRPSVKRPESRTGIPPGIIMTLFKVLTKLEALTVPPPNNALDVYTDLAVKSFPNIPLQIR